jgi:AcrR family transcriptional regulator
VTAAAPLTSRQLRAKETRKRLFAAAAELFDQKGYHQTTVDQIAKRAGVAKGTFFLHFATKDAVIVELVRLQTRGARRAHDHALALNALDRLRTTVLALGEMAAMSRSLSRAVLSASIENQEIGGEADAFFQSILELMILDARAAQEAELLSAVPDAETIAEVLMASYLGAALHFTSSPRAKPLMEILTPIVDANIASFRRAPKKKSPK